MELLAKAAKDSIASRVALEARRLAREVRAVVRAEILKVIHGEQDAVDPQEILSYIGLTEKQAETVARAHKRLIAAKASKTQIAKDLAALRVKLMRERAELIAEQETRFAHAMGQMASWERMLADGLLKGGRRAWHKLWVAADDERTCGVCMDLDGEQVPISSSFSDESFMPPDPHPRCRCRVVLVPAKSRQATDEEIEQYKDTAVNPDPGPPQYLLNPDPRPAGHTLDDEPAAPPLDPAPRADPRLPNAFNPAVGGKLPKGLVIGPMVKGAKALGSLKTGLHHPRDARTAPQPNRHARVDVPRYRVNNDEEGHWVTILNNPVWIKGPKAVRASPKKLDANAAVANAAPNQGSPDADKLNTSKPSSAKPNKDHGINPSWVVTFEDGTKGLLKPESVEWSGARKMRGVDSQAVNEVLAGEIGREIGWGEMFPAVVMKENIEELGLQVVKVEDWGAGPLWRAVNPEDKLPNTKLVKGRAALQRWHDDAIPAGNHAQPHDGPIGAGRMGVFDFAMGNGDRHEGNWLVRPTSGDLMFIDHGLMLSKDGYFSGGNRWSIDHARREYRTKDITEFTKPLLEKRSAIIGLMKARNVPQGSIDAFNKRMDLLATMKTFGDLKVPENMKRRR